MPENPPEVTFQPWNSLTVVDYFDAKLQCTIHSLTKQMRTQLDPTSHAFKDIGKTYDVSEFRLLIKVQSIRAWALSGKMIALSVEDFMVPNKDLAAVDQLCGLVDVGNAHHTPAVGFKLPISHQSCVLRDTKENNQTIFEIVCDGPAIAYVTVLWRCDGPSKLPQFNAGIEQLVRELRNSSLQSTRSVKNIETKTGKLVTKLDELIKKQPSLINEILKTGSLEAAAVSLIPGEGLREFFLELKTLRDELSECSSFDIPDKSELD